MTVGTALGFQTEHGQVVAEEPSEIDAVLEAPFSVAVTTAV